MSMTLVTLRDVYKYDVDKPYNLDIHKGEVILLKGVNGSGKTTLMRLLLGFIKPDRGSISSDQLKISYLPEHNALPFFMRGFTYIMLYAKMKKCEVDTKLLHLFDIPLFRYVNQMSKGNKQKLGIVTTLLGNPDMIIMDEPLSGLDDKSIQDFIDYLNMLKNKQITIIISSHLVEKFEDIKTRVIAL